jgi:uncharacterized membrane protein YdjX (TVP38/TMEM64 family)
LTVSRAIVRFGGLIILAAFVVALGASGWWRHLSPADLRAHYGGIEGFVRRQPIASLGAFALASAVLTASCLPGTGVLVVLGGALFGTLGGGGASLLGSVLGSTGVFLACRSAATGWVSPEATGRVARLMARFSRHAFSTLLVLRLTPIAPLSLINIAAGLARVRLAPFVAASLIGSAPSNLIYAGLGAGLRGALQHGLRLDPAVLTSPKVVWLLVALAALAGGTALVNLRRRR